MIYIQQGIFSITIVDDDSIPVPLSIMIWSKNHDKCINFPNVEFLTAVMKFNAPEIRIFHTFRIKTKKDFCQLTQALNRQSIDFEYVGGPAISMKQLILFYIYLGIQ